MSGYNGLLAEDLLQNVPDAPQRPTADCTSPAWVCPRIKSAPALPKFYLSRTRDIALQNPNGV
jgi:hypothetical protein